MSLTDITYLLKVWNSRLVERLFTKCVNSFFCGKVLIYNINMTFDNVYLFVPNLIGKDFYILCLLVAEVPPALASRSQS